MLLRNTLIVLKTIQPTTRAAQFTKNSNVVRYPARQAMSNIPAFVAPPPSTDTQPPDLSKLLTNFLDEYKNVINPLISLLIKVISKLLDK
ncbi:hypothetical protein QTP88_017651 [Uroleucon formosanum]